VVSAQQNDLMCRVENGAAQGRAIARRWIPAVTAREIDNAERAPVRVQLLGRSFVAFRDGRGEVGFLDERCPHRGASLALGRLEDCGVTCIYHGWKMAPDGEILDTPNVAGDEIKKRMRARAYPTRVAGGVVWVYIGDADETPAFPRFSWFDLDDDHVLTNRHIVDCNFVQVQESLVDTTHLGFLHSNGMRASDASNLDYAKKVGAMAIDLAPKLEVEDAEYGFRYVALRRDGKGGFDARVTTYVAPFTILNANGDIGLFVVPVSDTRTSFIHVFWDRQRKINVEPLRSEQLKFVGLSSQEQDDFGISPSAADLPGKPRTENNFRQDRIAMRDGRSFSGLPGLIAEDCAVLVSSGPIRDRSREIITGADVGIAALYRSLLKLAKSADPRERAASTVDYAGLAGYTRTISVPEQWRNN
jgi:phthalate 4,5-dioxygenase oxygenase subunit